MAFYLIYIGLLCFSVLPECHNETYIQNYCGRSDCQEDFSEARITFNSSSCPVNDLQSEGVEDNLLYILMGIYAGIGLLGALIIGVFVDPVTVRYEKY